MRKKNWVDSSVYWRRYHAKRKREFDSLWYKKLRLYVFRRDDFTCALTKKKGGRLHMHHIKSYSKFPKLRFDPRNLITLSETAHEWIRGQEKQYERQLWRLAAKREKEMKGGKAFGSRSRSSE